MSMFQEFNQIYKTFTAKQKKYYQKYCAINDLGFSELVYNEKNWDKFINYLKRQRV